MTTIATTTIRALAGFAGALAIASCASMESLQEEAEPFVGRTAQERANVANVVEFYNAAINAKNFTRARFYIGDRYVQHNPTAPDGIEGLEGFINFLRTTAPTSRSTIEGAYADGDFVILHVHSNRPEGTPGRAIVDIFRLDENGKVIEHWDIIQDVPDVERAQNENGMFYAVSPAEPTPQTPEQEEENVRIAYEFYDAALNQKDWPLAESFIGDRYVQHNLNAPDGPEGLEAHVAMVSENFPDNRGELQRAYVDGDRVFLHMHTRRRPEDLGMSVMDMFRVENGKVVEHWDVIQPVPETAANDNGMFYGEP